MHGLGADTAEVTAYDVQDGVGTGVRVLDQGSHHGQARPGHPQSGTPEQLLARGGV